MLVLFFVFVFEQSKQCGMQRFQSRRSDTHMRPAKQKKNEWTDADGVNVP